MLEALKWIQKLFGCMVLIYLSMTTTDIIRIAIRLGNQCSFATIERDIQHAYDLTLPMALVWSALVFLGLVLKPNYLKAKIDHWNNLRRDYRQLCVLPMCLSLATSSLVLSVSVNNLPEIWSRSGLNLAYLAYDQHQYELAERVFLDTRNHTYTSFVEYVRWCAADQYADNLGKDSAMIDHPVSTVYVPNSRELDRNTERDHMLRFWMSVNDLLYNLFLGTAFLVTLSVLCDGHAIPWKKRLARASSIAEKIELLDKLATASLAYRKFDQADRYSKELLRLAEEAPS